jgi:hypothetical protein
MLLRWPMNSANVSERYADVSADIIRRFVNIQPAVRIACTAWPK